MPQVNGKANSHTHGNEDDDEDEVVKGVPDIKIQGNVIKIDRKDVVWSSDEYEESDEEEPASKVRFGIGALPCRMIQGAWVDNG